MWRSSGQWTFSTAVWIAQESKECHLDVPVDHLELIALLTSVDIHTGVEAIIGVDKKEQRYTATDASHNKVQAIVCIPKRKHRCQDVECHLGMSDMQETGKARRTKRGLRDEGSTPSPIPRFYMNLPKAQQIPRPGFCICAQADSPILLICRAL
jgi:hypothetical protein